MFLLLFFTLIFLFKILLIFSIVILPGLKTVGLPVKSIIVDSSPILHWPPSNTNLILFLNSSTTSIAEVGLSFEAILALGAASGKFKILSKFLATLSLGILTATVLYPTVAIFEILDFSFFFKIKVIGPGQKAR